MAKYDVTRSCGHVETIGLVGKHKNREWRLEHVEPYKLCHECYQAELARQREEENREAAEVAKEQGLPSLVGTEKQVAWAETLRQKMLADIDELNAREVPKFQRNDPKLLTAIHAIRSKTEAKWWIDHRGLCGFELIRLLEKEYKAAKAEQAQPPAEVIADAKAEATVRPENPVTETVAEIRVLEDAIEVEFPERRDDFWEIVKKRLQMEWAGKFWRRNLTFKAGSPADRAAEAGHRLLAAGFSVRIFDEDIRSRAIAGSYEPEQTRWIQRRAQGEHEGWFAINWQYPDDFYGAAKAIRGSRYSKPSVVVPPEQYEAVLDFANLYGFRLTEKAQEIAGAAMRAKENSLIAKVGPLPEREFVVATGRPPVLEVPTEVAVADEFRDEGGCVMTSSKLVVEYAKQHQNIHLDHNRISELEREICKASNGTIPRLTKAEVLAMLEGIDVINVVNRHSHHQKYDTEEGYTLELKGDAWHKTDWHSRRKPKEISVDSVVKLVSDHSMLVHEGVGNMDTTGHTSDYCATCGTCFICHPDKCCCPER